MADKLKRLNKILVKTGLKGQLKPVETLDDAHIILLESKHSIDQTVFVGKDSYKKLIKDGDTFPPDIVHFLVSANPRNRWHIEKSLLSNKACTSKFGYDSFREFFLFFIYFYYWDNHDNNMAGLRLFYKSKLCDATDCTTNHILKVSKIEKNIVFHFDIQLIKNNLRPYFLPYKTELNRITHLQYMDTLGIIHLDKFTQDTIFTMPFPIVNLDY